jgi:transcriptional regulator with XRE-family HTH domain
VATRSAHPRSRHSARVRRSSGADPRSIAGLLRRTREAAGLTQVELAGKLGHTQQAVAQAERSDSNPTIRFLRRWAAACGTELDIRFKEANPPERSGRHDVNAVR